MKKTIAILISAALLAPAISHADKKHYKKYKAHHGKHHVHKAKHHVSNVFVSNTGDGSMALVQCKSPKRKGHHADESAVCKEVDSQVVGFATAWPANQYKGNPNWWWSGLNGQIIGIHARNSLDPLQDDANKVLVNTYTYDGVPAGLPTKGANFVGVTPHGKTVWNAAREIDEIQEIDTDPRSDTFGQILTHITVPFSGLEVPPSETKGRMRPCDMSITPNGKYLWEPDIGGETVTGVDIHAKKVIAQLVIPRVDPDNRVIPFMLTTNNKYAVLQNFEAPLGTVDVLDVSDPKHPKHIKKFTQADGLGVSPQTGEFTSGDKYHYIINNGSPDVPGDVDVLSFESMQLVKKIAMPPNCRPHAGDHTRDKRYFVVNCSGSDSVAVISNKTWEVVQNVAISGVTPRGVIVR